jgi:uncharacterized membrane protein
MKKIADQEFIKIGILGLILSFCILSTYYFHFIINTEIIFTHLFYIPIILAGLWWQRKGVMVGTFLALILLISNFLNPDMPAIWTNLIRAFMFVFIGLLNCIRRNRC